MTSRKPLSRRDTRRCLVCRWLLALGWMALIYYLSDQPDFNFVSMIWKADPVTLAAHLVEYGILTGLLWWSASATPWLARRAALFAFALALAYAIFDEVHQAFVPGRVPDVRDVAADVVGSIVMLGILALRRRHHRQM